MTIEQAAFQTLMAVGVPPHNRGFHYLQAAIVMCYRDPDRMEAITKNVYPDIAQRFGASSSKVERAMRYARMCSRSTIKTNAAFIAAAVWFLKQLDEPPV